MQQMNSGEQSGYGRYEGNQGYAQPPYEQAHAQPQAGATYDDNLVEALAQRVVQRMPQGKLYQPSTQISAGQRLALAIVSIAMLIPLAGIAFGVLHDFIGLIAFGIGAFAIFLINAVFNNAFRS